MNDNTSPTAPPPSHDLQFHPMTNDDAMAILTTAWQITKKHYEIVLGTTVLIVCVAIAIGMIPIVKYLSSLVVVFLTVGQMYVVRQLIDGKPAKFSDMFRPIQDQQWMNALLPLAISGIAIGLIQGGVAKFMEGGAFAGLLGSFLSLALTLLWVALTAFSGPLIAFKGVPFRTSLDINLRATTANWLPLLVLALYMMGFTLICLILLFFPVIFIALPVIYVSSYLTYAVLFEGLNIAALQARYKSTAA